MEMNVATKRPPKKREPLLVSGKDILSLYWGGYTIEQLIRLVASSERCTKAKAMEKVELIIYEDLKNERYNH